VNGKLKWIMFDLGNVLVEYKPIAYEIFAKKLDVDVEYMKSLLISDATFDLTGRGLMSREEYLDKINKTAKNNNSISMSELINYYSKEIETLIDGIEDVIKQVKKHYKLSILSNTFFAHWDYFEKTDFIKYFDLPMASHILGEIKPDKAIYLKALSKMNAKPEEVLFIDDLEVNVKAAQSLGINAFQTSSIEDTIIGLKNFGVIKD